MLGWIKRRLREWLNDEPLSTTLEIMLDGDIKKVVATGRIGQRLICFVPSNRGHREYLAAEHQACDKDHFWGLWRQFGGVESGATWEDGTPFSPS